MDKFSFKFPKKNIKENTFRRINPFNSQGFPCAYFMKWYFVTKIVLTYCEKKKFCRSRKTFEIPG